MYCSACFLLKYQYYVEWINFHFKQVVFTQACNQTHCKNAFLMFIVRMQRKSIDREYILFFNKHNCGALYVCVEDDTRDNSMIH